MTCSHCAKELRTVKQRITKLGKLMNAAEDAQLKVLLERACAVMQTHNKSKTPRQDHAHGDL
ncbi:MAG: hypothetical protein JWP60_706 [Ramlibacter sp.]|nr:hypothetical protein [Ramlibacter sp.]